VETGDAVLYELNDLGDRERDNRREDWPRR
jgi:hypothetical protein